MIFAIFKGNKPDIECFFIIEFILSPDNFSNSFLTLSLSNSSRLMSIYSSILSSLRFPFLISRIADSLIACPSELSKSWKVNLSLNSELIDPSPIISLTFLIALIYAVF